MHDKLERLSLPHKSCSSLVITRKSRNNPIEGRLYLFQTFREMIWCLTVKNALAYSLQVKSLVV
jgi:hypothetical protein